MYISLSKYTSVFFPFESLYLVELSNTIDFTEVDCNLFDSEEVGQLLGGN